MHNTTYKNVCQKPPKKQKQKIRPDSDPLKEFLIFRKQRGYKILKNKNIKPPRQCNYQNLVCGKTSPERYCFSSTSKWQEEKKKDNCYRWLEHKVIYQPITMMNLVWIKIQTVKRYLGNNWVNLNTEYLILRVNFLGVKTGCQ